MERLAGIADFLGEQTHTNTSLVVLIKREIYLKYLNCFAFPCFDQLRLCPHVNRPFRPPKTGFWKTLARVEIFKNGNFGIGVDRERQSIVSKVVLTTEWVRRSVFESFLRICVDGRIRSKTLHVDADIFENGEKNLRFQSIRIRVNKA